MKNLKKQIEKKAVQELRENQKVALEQTKTDASKQANGVLDQVKSLTASLVSSVSSFLKADQDRTSFSYEIGQKQTKLIEIGCKRSELFKHVSETNTIGESEFYAMAKAYQMVSNCGLNIKKLTKLPAVRFASSLQSNLKKVKDDEKVSFVADIKTEIETGNLVRSTMTDIKKKYGLVKETEEKVETVNELTFEKVIEFLKSVQLTQDQIEELQKVELSQMNELAKKIA